MGYESYLRKRRYRSQVGATNQPENIVIRYVSSSFSCFFVFEFESSRRFQLSCTYFSLIYRSAFAQIFPRSQPMRESNTSRDGICLSVRFPNLCISRFMVSENTPYHLNFNSISCALEFGTCVRI
jgi:hypothetical protein